VLILGSHSPRHDFESDILCRAYCIVYAIDYTSLHTGASYSEIVQTIPPGTILNDLIQAIEAYNSIKDIDEVQWHLLDMFRQWSRPSHAPPNCPSFAIGDVLAIVDAYHLMALAEEGGSF
jgi:hypothetical protein